MAYFPSDTWFDYLFGNKVDYLEDEFLYEPENYDKMLLLAQENKKDFVGNIAFIDEDTDSKLLDLVRKHGIFLLSKIRAGGGEEGDHIIVVPTNYQKSNTEPDDFWIVTIEDRSYDAHPLSNDLDNSIWGLHALGKKFAFKMHSWMIDFYDQNSKIYHAINKRVI